MSNLQCNLESDFCVAIVIIFFLAIICICFFFCYILYPSYCKTNKYRKQPTNELEY